MFFICSSEIAHAGASESIIETKIVANDASADDTFGSSVAIRGNTLVIGAQRTYDLGAESGSAYVFQRTNGLWSQTAKLTASDGEAFSNFGRDVAISEDEDTIVIGAFTWNKAYVFNRVGTSWTEAAKLTPDDVAIGDGFGISVDISGGTIAVGAYNDDDDGSDSGSVYIFSLVSNNWIQKEKLRASDAAPDENFGRKLKLSGDTLVVGIRSSIGSTHKGSAYIFERNGGQWTETTKLTAIDGRVDDGFGAAVGISEDQSTVIVSAIRAIDSGTGAVYVFSRSGLSWLQQAKLMPGVISQVAGYGSDVAVSGDIAVVSAPFDDVGALTDAGSAFVYSRSSTLWSELYKLTASDAAAYDHFGGSGAGKGVNVFGSLIAVSSFEDDDAGSRSGSVYVYAMESDIEDFPWELFLPAIIKGAQLR